MEVRRFLWCFCLFCGHADRKHPRELARAVCDDLTFEEVGKRLKCVRCGKKGSGLVFLSPMGLPGR